ncbi:PREDICTED: fibrinogen C domain-containing protein 1-like [Priapulus caudatus]|uniref:Fibrinogen C domain-containing protein 1-like n=1 Tax=Priapulus caudatus TaxID=37621 RepID=A0ABM1EBQ6_PRICU|nr:PREDICTED: fibrinogen C domain-containing protein 1-like [Priapulus caudatus]
MRVPTCALLLLCTLHCRHAPSVRAQTSFTDTTFPTSTTETSDLTTEQISHPPPIKIVEETVETVTVNTEEEETTVGGGQCDGQLPYTESDAAYLETLIAMDTTDLLQSLKSQLILCHNYRQLEQIFFVIDKLLFRLRTQTFHKYILVEGSCQRFFGCKDDLRQGVGRSFGNDDDTPTILSRTIDGNRVGGNPGQSIRGYTTDCGELRYIGERKSGIYTIYPEYSELPFEAFCDMETDGGGWTIFQKRFDGSVDFYRGWSAYKYGFGELKGEYWLGLKKLHDLTHQGPVQLRIDLEDAEGITRHAIYDDFKVTSEEDGYRILVGMYSGNAGDSLSFHNRMRFSTPDVDNDIHTGAHCAQVNVGAWWYRDCQHANLNGLYLLGANSFHQKGITWYHFRGYDYSLKRSEMKVRRVVHALHVQR